MEHNWVSKEATTLVYSSGRESPPQIICKNCGLSRDFAVHGGQVRYPCEPYSEEVKKPAPKKKKRKNTPKSSKKPGKRTPRRKPVFGAIPARRI